MDNMDHILRYKAVNVYGVIKIYPNCTRSKAFLSALGLKTFTPSVVKAIKTLGFEFIQDIDPATI